MLKLKKIQRNLAWGLSALSMTLINATCVFAADETPGGALPSENPFRVNWGAVIKGDLVTGILPLLNYGLGLYGLYLFFQGIRHLLEKSKQLMKGEVGYKAFIPVVGGFVIVLLVLSGAWYDLLRAILVPINDSFSSQK
ncbi:hypothetical protein [Desulfosporosinus shakirovi]|uniref:hypothetical protein n=1 Tax=Desulfosporosinus shakirovi TaxID=2885154 RepID=UPI001E4FA03A|nr:hypothetical protein [Desulfosporosinus sp. SRJS8]MCB8818614.1 hypothetical protein [Desulfosporosinus sp. SRJS8]